MRDLLRHVPTTAQPVEGASEAVVRAFRRDREYVNVTLNEELERYADAHGVELGAQRAVGDGFIYGENADGLCVWFLPTTQEIGALPRKDAEHYLANGFKPGEERVR